MTSHDVATLAGVSQPTVSRALRGDARVAAETRRRVAAAAARLGYVPSERGRSLSTRRTHRVGVVVDDLSNPFYLQLLDALHLELDRSDVRMLVFTSQPDGHERVERLVDGAIDGVVLTTTLVDSGLPFELERRRFPFVMLNREVDGIAADTCVADNAAGARQVAEQVVALGHRAVAAIHGPASTSTGRDREAGFRAGLARHGLVLPGDRVRRGPFAFATGYRALNELLDAPHPPTAVFCANDVVAMGALNAARARRIDIPGDLTLIGFDDIEMSDWEVFRLTTVRQDVVRMARTAASLLVQRIATPGRTPERVVLPARMILRETHGPAPPPAHRAP